MLFFCRRYVSSSIWMGVAACGPYYEHVLKHLGDCETNLVYAVTITAIILGLKIMAKICGCQIRTEKQDFLDFLKFHR